MEIIGKFYMKISAIFHLRLYKSDYNWTLLLKIEWIYIFIYDSTMNQFIYESFLNNTLL